MIIRTPKNGMKPFTRIENSPLQNMDLSWKAKGILAYLTDLA